MKLRNNRILIAWALFVVGFAATTVPAKACSPANEDIFPTNFEMVADVDAIVIARDDREEEGRVVFEVSTVLKGRPPATIREEWAEFGETSPSDPNELIRPHEEAYHAYCHRGVFERGKDYVLFLDDDEERGWVHAAYLFSRTAEDYFGPNSLWIKTIEYYLKVQKGRPSGQQIGRLKRDFERFRQAEAGSDEVLMALDIAWHLYQITPWKSFEFLEETYRALAKGETRPHAVMSGYDLASALGFDDGFSPMSRNLQFDWSSDFSRFFILRSMELGHEGKTKAFVRKLVRDNPRPHENEVGQVFRLLVRGGYDDEAIEFAEDNMLRVVTSGSRFSAREIERALTFWRVPTEHFLAFHEGVRRHGTRWAEVVLAIDVAWVRRFHQRWSSVDQVSLFMLLPDEPRDRPVVTRAMARAGMREAREWAKEEIDLYVEDDGEGYDYSYLDLPVDVLIHGYENYPDFAKILAETSFCAHRRVRSEMITGLRRFMTGETQDLAIRIANYPGLTPSERDEMETTLAAFVGAEYQARAAWRHFNSRPNRTMEYLGEFQKTGKISLEDYQLRTRAPLECM